MTKNQTKDHSANKYLGKKDIVFWGFIIWAFVSILYGYQYILRVYPAIAMNNIMSKFAIKADEFGYFAGIYYIAYSIGHIPMGIIVDKFSSRFVILLCTSIILLGIVPNFLDLWNLNILGRFLIGVGSSGFTLITIKLIRISFGEGFGKMIGFVVTIGFILVAIANKVGANIIENFGFEYLIYFFVTFGILIIIATPFFIPKQKFIQKISLSRHIIDGDVCENMDENNNTEHNNKNHNNENNGTNKCQMDSQKYNKELKKKPTTKEFLNILFNFRIISMSFIGGLMLGTLEGFTDAWVTPFFETIYGMTKEETILTSTFIFVGLCIGFPLVGYLAEVVAKKYSHTFMLFVSAAAMAGLFLLVQYKFVNLPFYIFGYKFNLVQFICLFLGILCGYQISVIEGVGKIVPERTFAFATSVANMIMMGFGSVFHTAIGKIVSMYNTSEVPENYSENALLAGVSIIPICLLIAMIWSAILLVIYREKNRQN